MGDGPEVPGEWDSSGSNEPPAQLLRRAISHVESLLHRLEAPAEPATAPAEPAPADGTTSPQEPVEDNVLELSRPVAAEESHVETEPEPDGPEEYVPLPGVSSAAQAEALRITLHAHEEAHRLRAEANGLRAEAAGDGERILVEARMLSDRLHVESRERATELLAAAKQEAAALLEAARAEADRIRRSALEEAVAARAEADARADQERRAAASAALADAAREAELIRDAAREQGRADAARLVEAEVAAAVEEGRRAVEAGRARAAELLDAANDSIGDVRAGIRSLIGDLTDSLSTFDASVGSAEAQRTEIAQLAPPPVPTDDAAADDVHHGSRRPLGLLFGAPRG